MTVILGSVVVVGCVMGGYLLHGGFVGVLLQWNEFLIIGGAALGSLLVGSPLPVLRRMAGSLGALLKGDPYDRGVYLGLLRTLYQLFATAKRDGLISLESHVGAPDKSHEGGVVALGGGEALRGAGGGDHAVAGPAQGPLHHEALHP